MEGTAKVEDGGGDGNAANIQMSDVTTTNTNGSAEMSKRKKKVIHFADGSTMEDFDDDDEDDATDNTHGANGTSVEEKITKSAVTDSENAPPVDTSKMQWPTWVRHYTSKAGTKTLNVLEGMGGTAAYYLGITTPKYQSEIDEYNRMVAKKKSQEEELVSWSSGPRTEQSGPVVEDIKNIETAAASTEEKK